MAVNDPNYRYATQTYEADGIETEYEIAFDGGYIRQSDVVAFSVLVDPETGAVSDRTVHPVTFLTETVDPENGWKSATVEVTPAVADGRRLVIFRSTEKSASLLNYQDNSVITEKNLDLANQQAIFGIAEIMDGLNAAAIAIDQQVQEVIDISVLVEEIYTQVIEILAAGGIVTVAPVVYQFGPGDGETTDFPLDGSTILAASLYDTYLEGEGIIPDVDYSIVDNAPTGVFIRFAVPPAVGETGFAVLRGYAQPYTDPIPSVTTLRIPMVDVPGTSYFVDEDDEFALLKCTSDSAVTVTLNDVPEVGDGLLGDGSYVSITALGDGTVTIAEPPSGTLIVPGGFIAEVRAVGSTVTATLIDVATNTWLLSGDMAVEV